ncbi:MAG TPA: 2OG-Fe(II) oxygenase [Noviherbaspirillum sp.]|nr:2OG-Fe(II) oxygenase [Noviherbaspirillum sp.]
MDKSAMPLLPQEWQIWITDNLARGCEPGAMANVMIRDGKFEATLARAAIEEARRTSFKHISPPPALQSRPDVDTSANVIKTPDREVDVLLTLKTPRIVLLGNVLSNEECDALIDYGNQRLQRSPVVSDTDGANQVNTQRTSRGAMLQRGESELVARIEARLAALTQWPAENGEGMQLLRYEKGNEYRPHFDWFDPALPGPRKHLERGGQRVGTVVMYLSEVEQGGGTSFPNLGLQVQPKKGSAVFFANTDPYGVPDKNTLHAGEPVMRGVKFIATKWLRERKYV